MRKVLSSVLVFTMILSVFGMFSVSAVGTAEVEADGVVMTWADFVEDYASFAGSSVKLLNDVEASELSESLAEFTGTFDGDGHAINGLNRALFASLNGATVQDLTLNGNITNYVSDVPAQGYNGIAALAYIASGSVTVKRCVNNASLSMVGDTNMNAGGFFPGIEDAGLNLNMVSCVNNGNIEITNNNGSAKNVYAGGLIGRVNKGQITIGKCINTGNIRVSVTTASGNIRVGGIMGTGGGRFNSCVNTGSITSFTQAGGIVGVVRDVATDIVNCYNYGTITGGGIVKNSKVFDSGAGGIAGHVGQINTTVTACVNEGIIKSLCETASTTDTEKNRAGGIVGMTNGAGTTLTIAQCIVRGTVSGENVSGSITGYTNKAISISDCLINASVEDANGATVAFCGADSGKTITVTNTKYVSADSQDNTVSGEEAWAAEVKIDFVGFQTGDVENGSFKVRFVSAVTKEALSYDAVGYEIIRYNGVDEVSDVGALNKQMTTVYKSLTADGVVFTPEQIASSADYFVPLTVNSVPAAGNVTFIVRPFLVDAENIIYGLPRSFTLVDGQYNG